MKVELVPKVGFDSAAAAVEQLAHAVAGDAAEDGDEKEEADGHLDLAEGRVGPEGVDAPLDEPGADDGESVAHDDEGQPRGVGSAIPPEVGEKRPQLVHTLRSECHRPGHHGQATKEGSMSRMVLATLTLAALAACGRGDRGDVASADSLNRDLQLAPVDTSATLNDQPAADTATPAPPATPAPAPAAKPKPKPAPTAATPAPSAQPAPAPAAAAAPAALSAGTSLAVTTDAEIHSRKNKVGDQVTATVNKDVKDATGQTVIPAGSKVTLQVTAIAPSDSKSDTTGTLTLKPVSVVVNGQTQPITASISGVHTQLVGRGVDATDAAKVGAGTAAGAIVGRVLGGGSKGAIIGGVIGGAVGTQRAVQTKDRDVVLPAGTGITVTLDQRYVAAG